ncbi:MAG: hypothetical protein IMHGJWDQ_000567 [Candidatus Fervidibacter sp.]
MEVEGRVAITGIQEELEQYRRLMEVPPPEEFEEGFSIRTILGALFVAFVMLPGAAYLGLVAGISGQLSSAAQWVTVILFVEVARRSFIVLKRQEIYLLVILATAILGTNPYTGYIWNVFMRTSQVTQGLGVADKIPTWVVPPADSPAILHRTFFHPDWLIPIAVSLALLVLGRTVEFTAGYILFRITSDYERLPFPMAPVGAQAATVLAEISRKEETWRWRYFSTGAMIGLAFGFFYAGIPTITGAIMTRPLQLIPIPFIDLTLNTESVLPATPVAIFTDLGGFLWGFVVPFWVAIGGFIGSLLTAVLNPLLYRRGILRNFKPGYDAIKVEMVNTYDFWLSAGIGRGLGLAAVSLASVLATTWRESQRRRELLRQGLGQPTERIPLTAVLPHRGDFPVPAVFGIYLLSVLSIIVLCRLLVPQLPIIFPIFFGLIYTPIISYVDARMRGLTGQWFGIPFVREGFTILYSKLTGYRGLDIWFAPIPIADYGWGAQRFREVELTGTKFTGVLKTEIVIVVIGLLANLAVWQYLWRLAPIPSYVYPFAQRIWPLQAFTTALLWTTTLGKRELQVLRPQVIGAFFGGVVGAYLLFSLLPFNLPMLLFYGLVQGLGGWPLGGLLTFAGALVSRFYFEKNYDDPTTWRRYATVLLAGYNCGMGLVGMFCAALAMISKSVTQLPY